MRRVSTDEERLAGAKELADWVNSAYGHDSTSLGEHLRNSHQLAMVLALLYEGSSEMHRYGLMILANLVSDAFDPKSTETKKLVYSAGVFERLKDFLFAGDEMSQTCACACLQNLCIDVRFARLLRSYELLEELERFVRITDNHQLRRFAAGTIHNAMEALQSAFTANSLENRDQGGTHGLGVLGRLMAPGAVDPEFEVSEEVMAIVSDCAAENAESVQMAEEAVSLLQAAVRRKRGRRNLAKLLVILRCVRCVGRCVRRWQRRRRRRAVMTLQMYARARMCSSRGICSLAAMRLLILGLRAAEARSISRLVHAQLRVLRLRDLQKGGQQAGAPSMLSLMASGDDGSTSLQSSPAHRTQALRAFGVIGGHSMRRRFGRLLLAGRSSLALAGRTAANSVPSSPMPARPPAISARLPLFTSAVPGQSPRIQPALGGGGASSASHARGKWSTSGAQVLPSAAARAAGIAPFVTACDLESGLGGSSGATTKALLASLRESTLPASPVSDSQSVPSLSPVASSACSSEMKPNEMAGASSIVDLEANLIGGEDGKGAPPVRVS